MIEGARGGLEDALCVLPDAAAGKKSEEGLPPPTRRTLAILYEQLGRLYRDVENYSAAINTFQEMLKLGEEEDRRAPVLGGGTYCAGRGPPQALPETPQALEGHPQERPLRATPALLLT